MHAILHQQICVHITIQINHAMDPVGFGADFWLAHWHLVAVNPVRTSTPSCISLTCLSSAGIPRKVLPVDTEMCLFHTRSTPQSNETAYTRQFMDLRLRLHSLPPTCIHSFLFAALAFASLRYAFDTVEGYQRILDSLGRRKIGGGIFQPDSEKVFFGNGNIPKTLGLALFLILGAHIGFLLRLELLQHHSRIPWKSNRTKQRHDYQLLRVDIFATAQKPSQEKRLEKNKHNPDVFATSSHSSL